MCHKHYHDNVAHAAFHHGGAPARRTDTSTHTRKTKLAFCTTPQLIVPSLHGYDVKGRQCDGPQQNAGLAKLVVVQRQTGYRSFLSMRQHQWFRDARSGAQREQKISYRAGVVLLGFTSTVRQLAPLDATAGLEAMMRRAGLPDVLLHPSNVRLTHSQAMNIGTYNDTLSTQWCQYSCEPCMPFLYLCLYRLFVLICFEAKCACPSLSFPCQARCFIFQEEGCHLTKMF